MGCDEAGFRVCLPLDAFQRGVTVADMLREILEGAVPEHGAAS